MSDLFYIWQWLERSEGWQLTPISLGGIVIQLEGSTGIWPVIRENGLYFANFFEDSASGWTEECGDLL